LEVELESSGKDNNPIKIQIPCNKIYLGSEYGGWTICPQLINKDSVIYSFGIGEDISFDLSMIEKFRVVVHAFDPTPRSINWIKKQNLPGHFKVHEYGISNYDGTANFYPPKNPDHISHSIMVRPETRSQAITVHVYQLSTIIKMLGNEEIDVLKMDIEGAEYAVIKNIIENKIAIKQLCVEFHHFFDNINFDQTEGAIRLLNENGYQIFDVSPRGCEISFINIKV
jgi:FkbM family methyltransferase